MNGFADLIKNAFIGQKPHELSIVIKTGKLGDIRRIAVSTIAEARAKCTEFNVTPRF